MGIARRGDRLRVGERAVIEIVEHAQPCHNHRPLVQATAHRPHQRQDASRGCALVRAGPRRGTRCGPVTPFGASPEPAAPPTRRAAARCAPAASDEPRACAPSRSVRARRVRPPAAVDEVVDHGAHGPRRAGSSPRTSAGTRRAASRRRRRAASRSSRSPGLIARLVVRRRPADLRERRVHAEREQPAGDRRATSAMARSGSANPMAPWASQNTMSKLALERHVLRAGTDERALHVGGRVLRGARGPAGAPTGRGPLPARRAVPGRSTIVPPHSPVEDVTLEHVAEDTQLRFRDLPHDHAAPAVVSCGPCSA